METHPIVPTHFNCHNIQKTSYSRTQYLYELQEMYQTDERESPQEAQPARENIYSAFNFRQYITFVQKSFEPRKHTTVIIIESELLRNYLFKDLPYCVSEQLFVDLILPLNVNNAENYCDIKYLFMCTTYITTCVFSLHVDLFNVHNN